MRRDLRSMYLKGRLTEAQWWPSTDQLSRIVLCMSLRKGIAVQAVAHATRQVDVAVCSSEVSGFSGKNRLRRAKNTCSQHLAYGLVNDCAYPPSTVRSRHSLSWTLLDSRTSHSVVTCKTPRSSYSFAKTIGNNPKSVKYSHVIARSDTSSSEQIGSKTQPSLSIPAR